MPPATTGYGDWLSMRRGGGETARAPGRLAAAAPSTEPITVVSGRRRPDRKAPKVSAPCSWKRTGQHCCCPGSVGGLPHSEVLEEPQRHKEVRSGTDRSSTADASDDCQSDKTAQTVPNILVCTSGNPSRIPPAANGGGAA